MGGLWISNIKIVYTKENKRKRRQIIRERDSKHEGRGKRETKREREHINKKERKK